MLLSPCISVPHKPQQLRALGRRRQVLVAALGDEHAVLDADAADGPEALQRRRVHVARVLLAAQKVRLDVRPAEVDARLHRHDHVRLQRAVVRALVVAGAGAGGVGDGCLLLPVAGVSVADAAGPALLVELWRRRGRDDPDRRRRGGFRGC